MWFFFQKLWKKFIFTLSFISFPFLIFRQDSFMIACDFSHDSLIFFNVIHSHDSFICTWLICFRMSCKKKNYIFVPFISFLSFIFLPLFPHDFFFSHFKKKNIHYSLCDFFVTWFICFHVWFVHTIRSFSRYSITEYSHDVLWVSQNSFHYIICWNTHYLHHHVIHLQAQNKMWIKMRVCVMGRLY